ncbi:MAG: hypothetical protein ACRDNS_14925, partial [Trebonia sp.]
VGTTVVSCREHRGHEVDLVALGRDSLPRRKNGEIVLLGEAKHTGKQQGLDALRRLQHIADLLTEAGWRAANTAYSIFSRSGFTRDLKAARDDGAVHLLDLNDLYQPN